MIFFSWALLPPYLVQFEVLLIRSEFVCNDGKGRCNSNQYLSQQFTTKARSSIYVLDLRNDIHIYSYFSLCNMVNLFIYWYILDFFFFNVNCERGMLVKKTLFSQTTRSFILYFFFLMKIRTVCSYSFFWFFFFFWVNDHVSFCIMILVCWFYFILLFLIAGVLLI